MAHCDAVWRGVHLITHSKVFHRCVLKVAMVKKLLKLASVNGHHKHVSVFSKLMPYSKYSAAESRTLSQNKTPKFWKKEQAAKKRRLC